MLSLSQREQQLIHYCAQGYTAKEIGRITGLHYRTIQTYLGQIKRKFNAKNIAHVIYIASHQKLLKQTS